MEHHFVARIEIGDHRRVDGAVCSIADHHILGTKHSASGCGKLFGDELCEVVHHLKAGG